MLHDEALLDFIATGRLALAVGLETQLGHLVSHLAL